MLISVRHTTTYRYATPARYSVHSLRLTPPDFTGQRVVRWEIKAPGFEQAVAFRDQHGNMAHLVTVNAAHEEATFEVSGEVETEDQTGMVGGLYDPAPVRVYLRETPRTAANEPIRDLARAAARRDRLDSMHTLMRLVREAIEYEVGATHAHTTAAEALADGRGVCQDHAHVFIAAARTAGVPARYVNGYFFTGGDVLSEAHHAWAEIWIEGLGWVGFDPANRLCPTDRYVRLACGLDSVSAAPVRGTRSGGEREELDVRVEVAQQGVRQQQVQSQA
jgi:transglutaminase-like putative cysteine protease